MGMRTTIYGYIEEMDFWQEAIRDRVREHNTGIIYGLPKADAWPPLSREMFAICENDIFAPGPNFEYSGRIIHFGANLKSFDLDWEEWKVKFETLLQNLFFLNANVHFQTEYSSLAIYSWQVDIAKYKTFRDGQMPPAISREHWDYESNYDN
jgi:hypothetical protein